MGQTCVKQTQEGGMDSEFINNDKSGDTYIVLYKQLEHGTDDSQRKRAHMAVVVDVQGASTDSMLCGVQIRMSHYLQH
jgi:hypothetical protein